MTGALIEKLSKRVEEIENFTEIRQASFDQKHLDKDSSERAYWHLGYASALRDVLDLVQGTRSEKVS